MTIMIIKLIDLQKYFLATVRELREKRGFNVATNYRALLKNKDVRIASIISSMKHNPTEKSVLAMSDGRGRRRD